MGETAEGFRQRAQMEAARYGSDPWVFVRELLQNARDAGAGEVRFRIERSGGFERVVCRDDGEGMTFEHARRFLFTLYASSKFEDDRSAGRFGIGFWSVLRFDPTKILVRSRPKAGDGWEVTIDGGFRSARQRTLLMQPGTEIVLERPASEEDLTARIVATVRSDVRFLMRRDDPGSAVQILVNDEVVTLDRESPPPAISVDEPDLQLTVSLAQAPSVEVFAYGIRVRSAAFLDELLKEGQRGGPAGLEIPDGLLPQIVIDSSRLQVLLARGDARQDRTMIGLVRRAEQELANLIRDQLDRISGRSPAARVWDRIRGSRLNRRWTAALVASLVVLAAAVGLEWSGVTRRFEAPPEVIADEDDVRTSAHDSDSVGLDRVRPYLDLASTYDGPRVDSLASPSIVDLRYRPRLAQPLFAALRVGGLDGVGRPLLADDSGTSEPYRGLACTEDCLAVDLVIEGGPGLVRVPVASGHRIDPDSVRLDGSPVSLLELESGEPAVRFDATETGLLSYVSGAGPAPAPPIDPRWPTLPESLGDSAAELAAAAPADRVTAATALVASLVSYDRSAETARRLERALSEANGLVGAAVAVGAGDCDVQNAVLATVLSQSGTPAWLVVGYVGLGGRVRPGLHAWVEYHDGRAWQVADASGGEAWSPRAEAVSPQSGDREIAAGSGEELVDGEEATAGRKTDTGSRPPVRWLIGAGLAVMLFGLAILAARRRAPARTVSSQGTLDLARLLRSALLRPEAFDGVRALFDRPLVPTVGGRGLSLRETVARSRAGRLFQGSDETVVARRASRRGNAVIDAAQSEGAAVADLLGARDLDGWEGVLDRARINQATEEAAAALRRLGGIWIIAAADRPPRPVSTIEGRLLGLRRRTRVVVVDTSTALWTAVESALPDRPTWAAFVLGEGIADWIDLDPHTRVRWLGRLARAALVEGGRQAP